MRVLLLFCHPVEDSYNAALHGWPRRSLERARFLNKVERAMARF